MRAPIKENTSVAKALSLTTWKPIVSLLRFNQAGLSLKFNSAVLLNSSSYLCTVHSYTLKQTQLHAKRNLSDEMTGMKCALGNELFGILQLKGEDALRPDDAAGRLLCRNVNSVWLQLSQSVSKTVYEAAVEKVESERVVLRMSSKACSDLKLFDTCDVSVNAQFQLNRWPICEMHEAVDRLTPGQLERLVFPEQRAPTAHVVNEVSRKEKLL